MQAVQEYYFHRVKKIESTVHTYASLQNTLTFQTKPVAEAFDDGSVVLVTESDLEGYNENGNYSGGVGNEMLEELSVAYRVQFASQAAIARLSCLWLRCHIGTKMSAKKPESSVGSSDQMGGISVDIRVY